MQPLSRRDFITGSAASLALLALPDIPLREGVLRRNSPPARYGRVATWWWQAVRSEPSQSADWVAWKGRDEVVPLYAAVLGEAPWPSNPVWYRTKGGYIHSGYVQPAEKAPQREVVAEVDEGGFWAEVCVPVAEARWVPAGPYVAHKLYYGTVYRVVGAVEDEEGDWWYRLQEGVSWSPGPYVLARSLRRILPEELVPISPGRPDKRVQISIADQRLTCFEGTRSVFSTRMASGVHGLGTPLGEFRVLIQRHTRRMRGGGDDDWYDLPGVPFPVYFTWTGVAIHGTYWHNDYGRRHSHGCVNLTSEAARWVFRWVEPQVPYTEYTLRSPAGEGTRVVVI